MRLIDADELKKHIQANAKIYAEVKFPLDVIIDKEPTVEPEELKPFIDKIVEILPELNSAIIKTIPDIVNGSIKCSRCSYYTSTWDLIPRPKGEWIPVETRDMTEEEKKEMFETWEYCTESDCWKYDCPLPEDGQEVLVSTKWGVSLDTFCVDEGCWFENHPDRGEVLAWMPLPEPYNVGGEQNEDS